MNVFPVVDGEILIRSHFVLGMILDKTDAMVVVRTSGKGVVIPDYLYAKPDIALHIGRNLPTPIPDLDIAEDAIRGTLSFGRSPFYCVIPWLSIMAIQTMVAPISKQKPTLKVVK